MERVSPNWVCLSIIGSFTFGVLGCGDVREDRSIAWSPAGDSVGFQHGRDGLYVWDAKAGQAQQIYQPPEEVIATSTPLWSPDGNRLVFLTATLDQEGCSHSSKHSSEFQEQDWDAHPEGRSFGQHSAVYDCWLCQRGEDRRLSKPIKLFQARCRHVGLIAANLAVRWHPSGDGLFYINRTKADTHQVFAFDLADSRSRAALPFEAENLLFDWTPTGKQVACVVQNAHTPDTNGIWIGSPGEADWWQVPFSHLALQDRPDAHFGQTALSLRAGAQALILSQCLSVISLNSQVGACNVRSVDSSTDIPSRDLRTYRRSSHAD